MPNAVCIAWFTYKGSYANYHLITWPYLNNETTYIVTQLSEFCLPGVFQTKLESCKMKKQKHIAAVFNTAKYAGVYNLHAPIKFSGYQEKQLTHTPFSISAFKA